MEKNKLLLNVVHRPELTPEYSLTVSGAKKGINESQVTESLDIFKLQQEIAHKNGLKTTIEMTYASLFNKEAIELAKEHHIKFGDEIGLTLLGLSCEEFNKKYKTKDFCIWMFDMETKKEIVDDVFGKFYQEFGFYPKSTGSYYMDADLINYIKEKYPSVVCAVATCFEEGPKAYHTCNNSWYTLFDGGPWAPWIPSKANTHAPAENELQDSGIVAIPHLSRDILACFDGNGSNFGTHPQNVLRGMIYENGEYPYLFNLIDQYHYLAKYNDGYSYNMVFVGPGWMNKMGRWEAPYELLKKSYEDCMEYYGKLKLNGELSDLTMSELAEHYRKTHKYSTPECALWKDILYGSDKEMFWYVDPYFRFALDMRQGGAMVDLRPYVSKVDWKVGIGTRSVQDCSYPFLIQEKYRAGYFTHYAGEGTVKSCKIIHGNQQVDMCLCRSLGAFKKVDDERILELKPVEIEFNDGFKVVVQTVIRIPEAKATIITERRILSTNRENEDLKIKEYMTFCYGTTEYSLDMSNIKMDIIKDNKSIEHMDYKYKNRVIDSIDFDTLETIIPEINTRVIIGTNGAKGEIVEGYAFSPMVTMSLTKDVKEKEVYTSWLKLQKEN